MSFKIWTHTSNYDGASTDGNVTIQIIGQRASGEHLLDEDGDDFCQNAMDDFTIADPVDVGNIREVRLSLEGGSQVSGPATWGFDRVVVQCLETNRMWEWHGDTVKLMSIGRKTAPAILPVAEVTGASKDELRRALRIV